MTLVTAVVVVYGEAPWLSPCVESLVSSAEVDVEVVVVDNGCTDASVTSLVDGPNLHRVTAPYNGGFGAGCNLGAAIAKGDVLVFVNPDAVPDPMALAHLASAVDDPTIGIAMGSIRLMQEPQLLNSAGGAIHFLGLGWATGFRLPAESFDSPRDVAAASGAGMAMRTETFRHLGGFTEELFLYHEDAELSFRCWLAGLRVVFIPKAMINHDYTFSRHAQKLYFLERNRLILLVTCYQSRTLLVLAPALILFEMGMLVLALVQGWGRDKVRGWVWLARNRAWLRRHRRRVQAERSQPDSAIVPLLSFRMDATQISMPFPLQIADLFLAMYWRLARRVI